MKRHRDVSESVLVDRFELERSLREVAGARLGSASARIRASVSPILRDDFHTSIEITDRTAVLLFHSASTAAELDRNRRSHGTALPGLFGFERGPAPSPGSSSKLHVSNRGVGFAAADPARPAELTELAGVAETTPLLVLHPNTSVCLVNATVAPRADIDVSLILPLCILVGFGQELSVLELASEVDMILARVIVEHVRHVGVHESAKRVLA